MDFKWNDDRVDTLKKLWGEGLSASQVSAEFWRLYHDAPSRSAVCGKIDRLGLGGRAKSGGHTGRPGPRLGHLERQASANAGRGAAIKINKRRSQPEPAIEASELPDLPPDVSLYACTLLELTEHSCRWPMGDPATPEFRFCGDGKIGGLPYCGRHGALARRP